jgi:hypothetical protein
MIDLIPMIKRKISIKMIRISGNINLISFLNLLFFGSLIPLSTISFSPALFNDPTQKKDVVAIGAIEKGYLQNTDFG